MKTIKKQIKTTVILIILAYSLNLMAQNEASNKIFIRVYNLEGKKINSGKFLFINDSVLGIKRGNKLA